MNKLVYWRAKRGLSVRELEEKSGVAASTISKLEKGKRSPQPSTLGKLATALEVDVTELSELVENTNLTAQTLSEIVDKKEIAAALDAFEKAEQGQTETYSLEQIEDWSAGYIAQLVKKRAAS